MIKRTGILNKFCQVIFGSQERRYVYTVDLDSLVAHFGGASHPLAKFDKIMLIISPTRGNISSVDLCAADTRLIELYSGKHEIVKQKADELSRITSLPIISEYLD